MYNYGGNLGGGGRSMADIPSIPPPPRLSNSDGWANNRAPIQNAFNGGGGGIGQNPYQPMAPAAPYQSGQYDRYNQPAPPNIGTMNNPYGQGAPGMNPQMGRSEYGAQAPAAASRYEPSMDQAYSTGRTVRIEDSFRPRTPPPPMLSQDSRGHEQSRSSYDPAPSRYDQARGRDYPQLSQQSSRSADRSTRGVMDTVDDLMSPAPPRRREPEPGYQDRPPAKPRPKVKFPEKIFSCECVVVFYDRKLSSGVVNLISKGTDITVPCFFSGENVLVHLADPLSKQLKPGTKMMVHAAMQSEDHPVPYCASYVWFMEGRDNKTMDENYFAPGQDSINMYKRKVNAIADILESGQFEKPANGRDDRSRDDRSSDRDRSRGSLPPPGRGMPSVDVPTRLTGNGERIDTGRTVHGDSGRAVHNSAPPRSRPDPASQMHDSSKPYFSNIGGGGGRADVNSQLDVFKKKREETLRRVQAEEESQRLKVTLQIEKLRQETEAKELRLAEEKKRQTAEATRKLQEERMKKANMFMNKAKRRFTEMPAVSQSINIPPVDIHLPPPGFRPLPPAAPAAPPPPPTISSGLTSHAEKMMRLLKANQKAALPARTRSRSPGSRRKSPPRSFIRSRSRSAGRRTRSPMSRRNRSRSKSFGRRKSPDARDHIDRRSSKRRSRTRSPVRRRSRSRERRRSRSRGRRSRSRGGRRSRSKQRSRSRGRRSRSRGHRSKSRGHRSKSRSRGERRKSKQKSRSRSRNIDSILKNLDPNIPSFLQHPADRMVGDKSKNKNKNKNQSNNEPDTQKARDESLGLLKRMGMSGSAPDNSNLIVLALEVEILQDEVYKQFTQLGAALTDDGKKQVSFFRSIIPRFMDDYNKNLILKNQNNLRSSLGMKYDEQLNKYLFVHKKKGEDVEPVSEEKALNDILGFIRSYCRDKKCIIYMHSKETFLPLLLAKLEFYKLTEDFEEKIAGFCDFTTLMSKMKLSEICKNAKFQDLFDVYKQVIGKPWPKDVTHKDGITSLSDNCIKKMINEINVYLGKSKLTLNKSEFYQACGLKSFAELKKDEKIIKEGEKFKEMCRHDQSREDSKEVELLPSERPGEVTIVTLKRFECIDVMDVDEVEEEGIQEDEYFESTSIVAMLAEDVSIKPGFVVTASMVLDPTVSLEGIGMHSLVSKNPTFGDEAYLKLMTEDQERLKKVAKCEISRQIVEILKSSTPSTENGELSTKDKYVIQVKILNPLDYNIDLKKDDALANVRTEKPKDPNNEEYKTYTMIKQAKDLENAKKQDDMLRENGLDKPIKSRKKKKKKSSKKKAQKEKSSEKEKDKEKGSLSFDFDALDFEPVNSGEEANENESNDEKEDDDVSLSDMSEADETAPGLDPISEGEEGDEVNGDTEDKSADNPDQAKVPEKSLIINPESEFYQLKFIGQLSEPFGGINLNKGATSNVCFKIQDARGYNVKHMVGRKCCVTRNQDFGKKTQNQAYKFEGLNIKNRIETVKKSSEGDPIINAFIENTGDKPVFYSNGVSAAWVTFFVPKDVSMDEVLLPPAEGVLNPVTPPPLVEEICPPGEDAESGSDMNISVDSQEKCSDMNISVDSSVPPGEEVAVVNEDDLLPPGEDCLSSPVAAHKKKKAPPATPFAVEPAPKKPSKQVEIPTKDQITKLTVKVLKTILTTHDLNTSGLKNDLVKRVEEFYTENPDKIETQLFLASKPKAGPVAISSANNDAGDLENYVESSSGSISFRQDSAHKATSNGDSPMKAEYENAIENKLAEMKAMDSLEVKFHDRPHYISLKKAVDVERPGENIITVRLGEVDIFFNDLNERKVNIRRDDDGGPVKVRRQICKVTLDGRIPMVDILVDCRNTKIEAMNKFFKVYIERTDKDGADQFYLPQSDVFEPIINEIFSLGAPLCATTPGDVVLAPKAFHEETCLVNIKSEEVEAFSSMKVILERTADHGMNIGMRKMILVPRIVSSLKIDGDQVKVSVRIYNASRQRLRISKKTNIAKVFLCKNTAFERKVIGTSVQTVKLQPGELTLVHCKLDSSVDDGTALLVDKGLVDQLTVVGGVVKVITKEDKQYVNIPVLNEAAHLQSVRVANLVCELIAEKD